MTRLIDADSIPWDVEGVGTIPVVTKEEIDRMPTVDAVPVSLLNERISELQKLSDSAMELNGGYSDASHYQLWELKYLLSAWAERK